MVFVIIILLLEGGGGGSEREREGDPSEGYFLSALIHIRVLFTDVHFQLISLSVFVVFLSSSSIRGN